MVAWVFTNTTVQYYGQPSSGTAKSLVKSAGYSFTAGPATLDSNGDGIPDYVKIARGLNITGSRDSDGDGYSDLEELIHGTNPLDAASVPTNFPHLDDQAVFDLHTTPQPWDGFANTSSLSATGMVLHVYDLQGSLLAQATGSNSWPVVPVTNITIVAEDKLVSESTDLHYNILTTDPDKKIGREMLSLVPLPRPIFPPVPYVFAGGNITNEAINWIASASNVLNNLPRALVSNTLTVTNTLEAMLFELETAQLLGARGFPSWTNLTLFPFRSSDTGRTNPPQSTLLSLESVTTNQPGYLLQSVFGVISNAVETSPSANIASLRAVLRDIYRIDSLLNNSNPATFISPVDETRYFLWHGSLDSNYLAHSTTSAQFTAATSGIAEILGAVSGRPTTNVFVRVRADTLAGPCHIVDLFGGGATFSLLDSSGLPFSFPNNFQMLPGTVLEIGGYTDLGAACGHPAIQVTSAALTGVPISTDYDANGNLLVDSWENKFFGAIGLTSPFADADGDGYSNLQEMLEESDPRDFYGRPSVPAVHFAPPMLSLQQVSGQVELHFTWPAAYVSRFTFGVRHTASLSQPFTSLAVSSVMSVAGDEFKLTFTQPAGTSHFYYLTVALP